MLGAIPSSDSCSSLNRFGPSSSAATTRRVQRSPTRDSASASGEWVRPVTSGMLTCIEQVTSVLSQIQQEIVAASELVGPSVVGLGRGWGRGSGVVVAPGRVLTNAHVLRGDEVAVRVRGGDLVVGRVIG